MTYEIENELYPLPGEWTELVEGQQSFMMEYLEHQSAMMYERLARGKEQRHFGFPEGLELREDEIPIKFPPHDLSAEIPDYPPYEFPLKFGAPLQFDLKRPPVYYLCSKSLYYPPFTFGMPTTINIKPSTNWYPVSVSYANPLTGRIEVGCLADQARSQKVLNLWGSNYGISEALGRVGIIHTLPPGKPRKVTVQAHAYVDAAFQGLACYKENYIFNVMDLILTVGAPTSKGYQYTPVSKTVFSKAIHSYGTIYDDYSAKSFTLSQSVQVPEMKNKTYLAIGVDASARVGARRYEESHSWNDFTMIDAEGYSNPYGEYYPKSGSVYVTGFSVETCPVP